MPRPAVPPQRRADRADAGASRALLLPKLLARTRNLPAGLGRMRPRALPGAIVVHRLPEQVFIDRAENLVGKIQRANFLPAQIVYVDSRHIAFRVGAGDSPALPYAFFAA